MSLEQYRTAAAMATATPPTRSRYADFLRATAILVVVLGHWLMAVVWIDDAGLHATNILATTPITQWLTWILQVMPLFFLVGGYSNAVSWNRHEDAYGAWMRGRLRRLVMPTVPLIGAWIGLGLVAPQFGLDGRLARLGSQVALVPLWFLAVYVVMVAATPLTVQVWDRKGIRAVTVLAFAAVTTDMVRAFTTSHVGFANYIFVWGAVYMMGHAWQQGFFADIGRAWSLAGLAGSVLVAMTVAGPYHISMVGVPGVEFGNTAPPSAALLALGLTQIGLTLAAAGPMERFLARPRPWTITILINGSIMTLYVWHMTAMALSIGLLYWLEPGLLSIEPGSVSWWLIRPLWIGGLVVATVPFLAGFRRFEAGRSASAGAPQSPVVAIAATVAVGVAFGSVALQGLTMEHPIWAAFAVFPLLPVALWLRRRPRITAGGELQRR